MPGVSNSCISSQSPTPSPNTSWAIPARPSACLVKGLKSVFALPLAIRIHEGLVFQSRPAAPCSYKMLATAWTSLALGCALCYFVADAYYAAQKIVTGPCCKQRPPPASPGSGSPTPSPTGPPISREALASGGRPKGLYWPQGQASNPCWMTPPWAQTGSTASLFGKHPRVVEARNMEARPAWWRPGRPARGASSPSIASHPRTFCLLMYHGHFLGGPRRSSASTAYRFKDRDDAFKQRLAASWASFSSPPSGCPTWRPCAAAEAEASTSIASRPKPTADAVRRKLARLPPSSSSESAVSQGILLGTWPSPSRNASGHAFGSWLRTVRPGIPPSELVVANALRQSMPEFLLNSATANIFAKFVIERQDTDKMQASGSPPSRSRDCREPSTFADSADCIQNNIWGWVTSDCWSADTGDKGSRMPDNGCAPSSFHLLWLHGSSWHSAWPCSALGSAVAWKKVSCSARPARRSLPWTASSSRWFRISHKDQSCRTRRWMPSRPG